MDVIRDLVWPELRARSHLANEELAGLTRDAVPMHLTTGRRHANLELEHRVYCPARGGPITCNACGSVQILAVYAAMGDERFKDMCLCGHCHNNFASISKLLKLPCKRWALQFLTHHV